MKNSKRSSKIVGAIVVAILLPLTLSGLMVIETSGQEVERAESLIAQIDAARIEAPEDVFNPFVPAWSGSVGTIGAALEHLFIVNLHTGEFIPWVAERYEYNDDFTEFTVFLREGVEWSDGEPYTADDVVFSYEIIMENPAVMQHAGVLAMVESVEKIDDLTVKFHLKTSNARFHLAQDAFSVGRIVQGVPIVPKHIWEKEDPLTFRNYPPLFSGPYKLKSVTETEFVWERRDDWWGTKVFGVRPGPKYLIWKAIALEETVAMMLTKHEIDSIARMSTGLMADVKAKNPYMVTFLKDKPYQWFDPCPTHLHPNFLRYPFNITEVRRAISYMVDRDELVEVGLEFGSRPTKYPVPEYGGMIPFFEAIDSFLKDYKPLEYSPAKAKALLESVGFTMGGDGIWVMPNGQRFSITLTVHEFEEDEMAMTPILVKQLTDGGIDVAWKALTHAAVSELFHTGDFDIIFSYTCPGDSDPFFMMDFWHSRFWRPEGEWAGSNFARFENSAYDAILEEWAKTPPTDLTKCVQLWTQASEIYYENVVSIPVTHEVMMSAAESYYWVGWPNEDDEWIQPCCWWASFMQVYLGYASPKAGGQWVKGLRPREVQYVRAYFTGQVPKFRGIDLAWYGPFVDGDSYVIPTDDADFLKRQAYPISLEAPGPQVVTTTVTETVPTTVTTTVATTVTAAGPGMDVTAVAGAGIVALIVGVVVGWLVGSRKK